MLVSSHTHFFPLPLSVLYFEFFLLLSLGVVHWLRFTNSSFGEGCLNAVTNNCLCLFMLPPPLTWHTCKHCSIQKWRPTRQNEVKRWKIACAKNRPLCALEVIEVRRLGTVRCVQVTLALDWAEWRRIPPGMEAIFWLSMMLSVHVKNFGWLIIRVEVECRWWTLAARKSRWSKKTRAPQVRKIAIGGIRN